MNDPISVIIPTYNRANLIGRAIDSALAAILPGDEVIVVDDGSTDATEDHLKSYGSQIHYNKVEKGGAGRARNIGLQVARNNLIAFLDSDDEWMTDRLMLGRAFMQVYPDIVFCFSNFGQRRQTNDIVREHNNWLNIWLKDWLNCQPIDWSKIFSPGIKYSQFSPLPSNRDDFMVYIGNLYIREIEAHFVHVNTLLFNRGKAGFALRFPEDLPTYEDWEFCARLAKLGPCAYFDCDTAWQWGHRGLRLTNADELICANTRITILNRVWGTDQDFLAKYEELYYRILKKQYFIKAKQLIRAGHITEVREEIRCANIKLSLLYQFLLHLPSSFTKWGIHQWDRLLGIIRKTEPTSD